MPRLQPKIKKQRRKQKKSYQQNYNVVSIHEDMMPGKFFFALRVTRANSLNNSLHHCKEG